MTTQADSKKPFGMLLDRVSGQLSAEDKVCGDSRTPRPTATTTATSPIRRWSPARMVASTLPRCRTGPR